jgi:hypothetical protein
LSVDPYDPYAARVKHSAINPESAPAYDNRLIFGIIAILPSSHPSANALSRHSPDERPEPPTLKQHRSGIGREV